MTTVTLTVHGCEACTVVPSSAMRSDPTDVWTGPPRKVVDGKAVLRVPTDRTAGLSLALDAPWEGDTGYQTMVALRYRGQDAGDRVSFREARGSRRASGCWAGTTASAASMTVEVWQVPVAGNVGTTAGTIAWTAVTQEHLAPMQRSPRGVLGTQDVFGCGPS